MELATIVKAFQCECGKIYNTNEEAESCCIVKKYVCPVCEDTWDDEDSAQDCCPKEVGVTETHGEIDNIDGFECWNCYRLHETEQQAKDCCGKRLY